MKFSIKQITNKLKFEDGFFKSVSILTGGTAFAQALAILVLPILTRIYTPDDFSILATYTAILSILSVATCLRFEIAIPLPEKDKDALALILLAQISNLCFTAILILALSLFQDTLLGIIKQPQLKPYIWLLPLGVFLSGLYNSLQFWSTRKKKFGVIAQTRITQSIAGSSVQLVCGYIKLGALGLIAGQVVISSSGILRLSSNFFKGTKNLFQEVSINLLKKNWIKYDKFPKYSTFESIANVAAIQLPIVIIAAASIGPEAGFLMLAMKVTAIPMGLIGKSISQVYLAHAPQHYHKGQLKKYTINIMVKTTKLAIIPLIAISVIAPSVFSVIFGNEWSRAGDMLIWMAPWFIMQLLTSPISMSLHITGNQAIALILQIFGLVLRVGGLLLISSSFPKWSFEYYALSGFFFYLIYLLVILHYIGKPKKILI